MDRYPHFSKVHLPSLHFHKRPILILVFTNGKKSEAVFHFLKKVKIVLSICFAASPHRGSGCSEQWRVAPLSSFSGITLGISASQHQAAILWTVSSLYLSLVCAFLLLLFVSAMLVFSIFMCCLVWFGRLFLGSGIAQKFFHVN